MKRILGLALLGALALAGGSLAQQPATPMPVFEPDTSWPQALPNNWVMTGVTKVSVDRHDNIYILHR
ncbi:MAG TPA: hypothetical protein VJ750_07930, partial [Rhizomicrobium sp.]|nr:hypothetical protein [Rhizomicrobium sp.]